MIIEPVPLVDDILRKLFLGWSDSTLIDLQMIPTMHLPLVDQELVMILALCLSSDLLNDLL